MTEKTYLTSQKDILRKARKKAGLSQAEVADIAEITIRQYQSFELGERSLVSASLKIAYSICEVLDISPSLLISLDKENAKG